MDNIWEEMYKKAVKKIDSKELTPFTVEGNNICVIQSEKGNFYIGKSITSGAGINCCSEKSAVTSMLNNDDNKISKILIINELEELIYPCEECLPYLLDFGENAEILTNITPQETKKINELLPEWWGTLRIK